MVLGVLVVFFMSWMVIMSRSLGGLPLLRNFSETETLSKLTSQTYGIVCRTNVFQIPDVRSVGRWD